jgi:enoyl-CoA hydratase/carnithine racemase
MNAASGQTAEPPLRSEVRDGVGIITINRPARLNAWAPGMGRIYFGLLEKMAKDPEVRAILLTGEGRAFCAGADMSALGDISAGADVSDVRDPRPYWFPLTIGKPIVAAVRGPCIGMGVQLMAFCDVRFVAEDLKLAAVYAKRGLVAELALAWMLPRLIGVGPALDMLLSGRSIDAQEARALGLATRVAKPEALFDEAFEYCAALARECAPSSLRAMKLQVYSDLMTKVDVAYDKSEVLLNAALAGADLAEGIQAFKDKRKPQFPPLDPALWSFDLPLEP